MNEFLKSPPVFIEINPASLRVLRESNGLDLPLQRAADGKLTAACRKELISALQRFWGRKNWQPRVRAICGISAHGVSLRKIALPSAAAGELESVLRLQIEKEFPLPPDQLAWGWREINNDPARREAVITAIRKEVVEDYARILSEAGANPEFTLSVFARELLCQASNEPHAILEIGRHHAELASVESGVTASLKILPANGSLADAVQKNSPARIIYVSGNAFAQSEVLQTLSARMDCRRLEVPGGAGFSAATAGLKKSLADNIPLPRLQSKSAPAKIPFNLSWTDFTRGENRRWLVRAAVLLLSLLLLPYAEALVLGPLLAWKLASFKAQRQQFTSVVEPELRFLQSFKQNQPPYLDAMYVFSQAASPGGRLDSLALNQQGDIAIKATMQNAQQVMDFRAKLIASGFFDDITVEEQTPVQNQPKVSVRMTAQWKSAAGRPALKIGTSPEEIGKANSLTNAAAPAAAGIPQT
ncbi:MAG: type IV pilus biogenesis protein PilM [Limisphaerales bacterium]